MATAEFDAVVIGAGVSGLSTAICLQRNGRRVAIVTAAAPDQTTSNLAAAVWFPTHVGRPDRRDRVLRWGARTFAVLTAIARDHPDAGVVMRRTLMLYREPPGRPWWTAAVGDVTEADPGELPAGYSHGLRFVVPLAEMPAYLPWLTDRFASAGGVFRYRRLTQLGQVAGLAPVVVNCSGLAARTLVGDTTVVPVRGQIVRTTNPGLSTSLRDVNHPEGYTYVHPREHDCILGGTLEAGRWDTDPDPDTAAAIVRRCRQLAPELARVTVLEHVVGLRPGRPTVRLEIDAGVAAGPTTVHNYGHGGAGVTLSWGCAEEVVALLDAAPPGP